MVKCSTIGPNARAGRNVSAPTSTTDPISRATKSGPVVGRVPSPAGMIFLAPSDPAMASTGMATKNRPSHIATESATL